MCFAFDCCSPWYKWKWKNSSTDVLHILSANNYPPWTPESSTSFRWHFWDGKEYLLKIIQSTGHNADFSSWLNFFIQRSVTKLSICVLLGTSERGVLLSQINQFNNSIYLFYNKILMYNDIHCPRRWYVVNLNAGWTWSRNLDHVFVRCLLKAVWFNYYWNEMFWNCSLKSALRYDFNHLCCIDLRLLFNLAGNFFLCSRLAISQISMLKKSGSESFTRWLV